MNMLKRLMWIGWVVLPLVVTGGCTHLSGVVMSGHTGQPVAHTEFSVGQPGEVAAVSQHYSKSDGTFDFWVSTLDEDNLWVWSGQGDPSVDALHVDPATISTHMRIVLPPSGDGLH